MTLDSVPLRSQIPFEMTWNAASVFSSEQAWEDEVGRLKLALGDLARYQGHLADGPETLARAFQEVDDLRARASRVLVYAGMLHAVDAGDQRAAGMHSRSQGLRAQVEAETAFLAPELLDRNQATLAEWIRQEPALAAFAHYFGDLLRKRAHVRSIELEQTLGMLTDSFAGAETTAGMLTRADFQFAPAATKEGAPVPLAGPALMRLMAAPDREIRRTAWESFHDTYLAHKNTLASNLATSIKQDTFLARVRHHPSTLEAALFQENLPVEVFDNLIATFRRSLPTWKRYWRVRRKALGVGTLHPYDMWAPLTGNPPTVPFTVAVEWICAGLAPLGHEYVETMRRGCLEERWVDMRPNRGKGGGAFSWGTQGTHPFIVMSYSENIRAMSTLAHELGHSMHSYLTWQNQPYRYSDYSLFVAEVASNFHQAMVRAYLLETHADRDFQIAVIEEALSNFYRYLFTMPTLAQFELEMHRRVECGRGLTAEGMIDFMADLYAEGFGDQVNIDRPRLGINWATFGHLYTDYYVFQYATGISGAHALARRVLSGEPDAAEDYLRFLKAGASVYPLEALRIAGVDLAQKEPIDAAFQELSDLVDRLETLVG